MRVLKFAGYCLLTAAIIWAFYLATLMYGQTRFKDGARYVIEYCNETKLETTLP